MLSEIITLLIGVIIIGLVCWLLVVLIERLPMDGRFKNILRILVIVVAVLMVIERLIVLFEVPATSL
jgi:energy-converting hydrogenase Eha subunit B